MLPDSCEKARPLVSLGGAWHYRGAGILGDRFSGWNNVCRWMGK